MEDDELVDGGARERRILLTRDELLAIRRVRGEQRHSTSRPRVMRRHYTALN
jgi:hypothetical protein